MYDRLIRHGVDFMYVHGNVNEENREIYSYGLELIIMYLVNAGTLLLLGLIFRCFLQTLLLLFGFSLLQSFAGGYHAMTHLRCFLLMLVGWAVTMLLIPLIATFSYLHCLLAIFGLSVICLLAPVKHENYPMSTEKERKMRKISCCIALLLCSIVFICSVPFLGVRTFAVVLGTTMFMSAISMICAVLKEVLHKEK